MSGGSKFSSEVPKGDAWGVEAALEQAAAQFEATGHSPMIPCIAVLGVKEVKLISGDDGPARQIVAKLFRVNALTTAAAIRDGEKVLLRALADQAGSGEAPTLQFEESEVLRMAFGGLNIDQIERDEREAIEDQNMDDPQRLRRHLTVVHGVPADEVEGMEWFDVQTRHNSDHDRPEEDGLPQHDRESWLWRRVDLEAAEAEADETSGETLESEDFADADVTHEEDGSDRDEDDDTADDADDAGAVPAAEFQAPADRDQED